MYGEEPSASADRDPGGKPSWAGGGGRRAEQFAAFIPEDVRNKDPQFGWNSSGTSVAQSTEVAGIDVRSADTAAVMLPASGHGQPAELGGPRYAADGRPVAPGRPAWLPAPPAAVLPRARQAGSVSLDGITALPVPRGGATRRTPVTLDLTIPGQVGAGALKLVTTYDMSVIDRQSGRWYVKDIRASTQPMGTP